MATRRAPWFWIETGLPRRWFVADFILFIGWVAVIGVAVFLTPDVSGRGTHTQLGLPACAFLTTTGRPCPSCGLTTAFTNLVHGDLASATAAHPLGPPLFLYAAVAALYLGSKFMFRYRIQTHRRVVLWPSLAALAVFLAYGFVRWMSGGG
ncbi:MAG: DUF2752 domain-containing protein [Armatimonadetes bacterium]|nr:DUF2752 domain-containing protein [Armatimonadota bacterium]